MLRNMLRSKVSNLTITDKCLYYEGSITLDPDLLAAADLLPNERVDVLNLNNGARLETYIIEGEKGSNCAILNGPAARLGEIGDQVIVLAFGLAEDAEAAEIEPKLIKVDENNRPKTTS